MDRPGGAWRAGFLAGAATAVVGSLFAWLGVVNGDEGWYGLAARAIGDGRVPYRDFALAQGPGYPTFLAPFVALWPNLGMTRAVSVLCAAIGVGLLVATAHRVGGRRAALISSVALLATVPSLPYWLSITKTYAFCFLLLAAIVFLLAGGPRPRVGYPIAAVLAVGLVVTRTTGIAIAAPLVLALLVRAPDRATRRDVLLGAAIVSIPFAVLLWREWPQAHWGLYEYHHLALVRQDGPGRYVSRSVGALRAWPGPVALAVVALVAALRTPTMRAWLRRRLDVVAFAVGIPVFVLLHESGGIFFTEEYLAPLIGVVVVGSVLVILRAVGELAPIDHGRARRILVACLTVGIVATAVTGGHRDYLGRPGWRGSIAGLDPINRCIREHSVPTDEVLALYVEEVVLQTGRRAVPGASLGSFSYQDVSTARARQLRILNSTELTRILERRPPKVLVFTPFDFNSIYRGGWFSDHLIDTTAINRTFLQYRPVCRARIERNVFNNLPIKVDVYVRNDPAPRTAP